MNFIIQKDYKDLDLLVVKEELNKQKFQHSYIEEAIDFFKNENYLSKNIDIKKSIPIGTIDFVQEYLRNVHSIDNMNPIEVPNELRLDKFLNRKYSIISKEELLTKNGYYFVKYVSKLKYFSSTSDVSLLMYEDDNKKDDPFLKDGLYVFSEVKNILSEYRVYVYGDKIEGIQFYDGDPTIMPTIEEINKIKEMVLRYTMNVKRPGAYTLDIAVIKADTPIGRDIMVIECHPFTSIGLYGVCGSFLPYAYALGIDYYIKNNTPLSKFSNF